MREKIAREYQIAEKVYTKKNWEIFFRLRESSFKLLELLKEYDPLIHGSIARGDVHPKSDMDIIFLKPINEFQIINNLNGNYQILERWIVQATPLSAIKAHLILNNEINITFPLIPFYPREEEFYKFGGALSFTELKNDKFIRTTGINKRLLVIYPNDKGHKEFRVTRENANIIAKILKIKIDTISERIRVLERRDQVGRTGVFVKRLLIPDESFGEILTKIENENPATRRRIKRKKI